MQETKGTQVRPLGWEDPLEKVVATHSNILAWRIPRTEEPGGLQSEASQGVKTGLKRRSTEDYQRLQNINISISSL